MESVEAIFEEWKALFDKESEFYIYGAASLAKKCVAITRQTGVINKIKGFVVSDGRENPVELEGFPVSDIHDMPNKDAGILVTHLGFSKREICRLLEELGFRNIYLISKYMEVFQLEYAQKVDDAYIVAAEKRKNELVEKRSDEEKSRDERICREIEEMRREGDLDFGSSLFYQSFETIGLKGRRPTLYRLEKYGIENFLNQKCEVLDIGCNAGFLDMTIAPFVNHVLGIEYDCTLVKIANYVKEYLHMDNCEFLSGDFVEWQGTNKQKFDVIFSFAVHHWLNMDFKQYVKILSGMLKENGYICFESLGGDTYNSDEKYTHCIEAMIENGFLLLSEGCIMDDGVMMRRYAVLERRVDD